MQLVQKLLSLELQHRVLQMTTAKLSIHNKTPNNRCSLAAFLQRCYRPCVHHSVPSSPRSLNRSQKQHRRKTTPRPKSNSKPRSPTDQPQRPRRRLRRRRQPRRARRRQYPQAAQARRRRPARIENEARRRERPPTQRRPSRAKVPPLHLARRSGASSTSGAETVAEPGGTCYDAHGERARHGSRASPCHGRLALPQGSTSRSAGAFSCADVGTRVEREGGQAAKSVRRAT